MTTETPPPCTGHDRAGHQCILRFGHRPPCRFFTELEGARQNAELVSYMAHPRSADDLLAKAVLLLVQHLDKVAR